MNSIIVNPNTSISNINHLYSISASLSRKLVQLNYGVDNHGDDKITDLRNLFYKGNDPRLYTAQDYLYNNYRQNNVDEIPASTGYEELRKIVNQIKNSKEYERKTNLIKYFNNVVFGDFVLGYSKGSMSNININLIRDINNSDQIVKSYMPGYYKFLHVTNAPTDLCAYVNVRCILFKMNKLSNSNTSTSFTFQYPVFLLEQYQDLSNNVLCICFNKTKHDLAGMKITGATESKAGNITLKPTPFTGLNYFKTIQ